MANINKLSAVRIARLVEPGRYSDGGGLYLRVAEYPVKGGELARSKNWLFRFERDGKERQMGLGSLHTLSLADAREKARDCRKALLDGLDPIEARRARRMATRATEARGKAFKECGEAYIKAHSPGWKNRKSLSQWKGSLGTYVYPIIGNLSVAEIDTALVMKCIEPIWTTKSETAGRVRGRIESVLDWAKARGFRDGENPARWRGHLDNLLAPQSKVKRVKHLAAVPYTDVPAFMNELRGKKSISARALEFTILTAARTGEVIEATEGEFDFAKKVWHVPADRMKGERAHDVPLSDRAIEILRGLPREVGNEFLFPGARAGKPLSDMAMLECLRGFRPGFTVHGFRSSFRDWAGDCTNYPREIIEGSLAHKLEDKTEAAYRRSTAIEKRRHLMNDWARFCDRPQAKTSNVLAIGERRR